MTVSPPQPTAEPVRQHTPTPWHIRPEGTIQGAPADGERYGDMVTTYNGLAHPRTRGIANADLIVTAVNSHVSLKARAEQAEQEVFLLESNAREQAKLLADTGRRVGELLELVEAIPGTPDEDPSEPCEELCGNSWCNEFGCIAQKKRDARATLPPSTPAVSR